MHSYPLLGMQRSLLILATRVIPQEKTPFRDKLWKILGTLRAHQAGDNYFTGDLSIYLFSNPLK